MSIQVMIAEDEHLAREELIYLLKQEEDLELCPSAETGEQLLELYFNYEPDVIFLDVEMPGMSGIEAAKRITELAKEHPLFIFSTAYDAYAMDAFEVEAVDYLLKPYDHTRFQQMMDRLKKRLKAKESNEHVDLSMPNSKLLIDDGDRMIVLAPESIYYAVPSKRMLEIHTENNVFESKMTLQELEAKLKGYSFFRTHRSYLVNLNHVLEITPWFNGACNVKLKDKKRTTVPVSRSARKALFEIFGS
ncbi:LytR/AlgR family response regulator transcription factor [Virgibacillus sp. W0430]|uniref:LytR/AlgR family response regulator transcription factor n=1 Tax=Virgibacillus sp. W0430 TaxID=3391580 RepID=UPI003F46F828